MIFCAECGSVNDADSERFEQMRQEIAELRAKNANLREQNEDLKNEIAVKVSQLSHARGERNERLKDSAYGEPSQRVFDYWKATLSPGAREFKGKRLDAVIARLKAGYRVEDLFKAIDGCARRPYVTNEGRRAEGRPDERRADLELICRSPEHVDRFMSYADSPGETSTVVELVPDANLPVLLKQTCDCGHSRAEHIPPRLLAEAHEELRLVIPADRNPCAHQGCPCNDFDDIHQRADAWMAERNAQERRRQMRSAA